MDVTCPCGTVFPARHPKARYCSDRCRKRKGKSEKVAAQASPIVGGVERTTQAALEKADRLDTPLGQTCLVLARRLDFPGLDTGSAVASLAARLEATLAAANKGSAASRPQQLRDELAARRAQHGA